MMKTKTHGSSKKLILEQIFVFNLFLLCGPLLEKLAYYLLDVELQNLSNKPLLSKGPKNDTSNQK